MLTNNGGPVNQRSVELDLNNIGYLREQVETSLEECDPEDTSAFLEIHTEQGSYSASCQDAYAFVNYYDRWLGEGVFNSQLPYQFRFDIPGPEVKLQQKKLADEYQNLMANSKRGAVSFQSTIDASQKALASVSVTEISKKLLPQFLYGALLRAFDYSGYGIGQKSDTYSIHNLAVFTTSVALMAASGLERISLEAIQAYLEKIPASPQPWNVTVFNQALSDLAKSLDGNPDHLTPTEKVALEIVQAAFYIDAENASGAFSKAMSTNPLPHLPTASALALLGVFTFLNLREVETQIIYINLDEVIFDVRAFLPNGKGSSDFVNRTDPIIKAEIIKVMKNIYKDFPHIRLVFLKPTHGTYSRIDFVLTVQDLRNYLIKNWRVIDSNENNSVDVCNSTLEGVLKTYPSNILQGYFARKFPQNFCLDKKLRFQFMTDPLTTITFRMENGGTTFDIDFANQCHNDIGLIHYLVTKTPQTFTPSEEFIKIFPGKSPIRTANTAPTSHLKLNDANDVSGLQKLGLFLAITASHEMGHLLGLTHSPSYQTDPNHHSLMDESIENPEAMRYSVDRPQLSPFHHAMLAQLFFDAK